MTKARGPELSHLLSYAKTGPATNTDSFGKTVPSTNESYFVQYILLSKEFVNDWET